MLIVKAVLVLLGGVCLYLAYMYISTVPSERAKARRLQSLEDAGRAAEALIVSLRPFDDDTRAEAVLELEMPGGNTVREKRYVRLTPEMTVGVTCPIVRHSQFPDRFEVGVKEDVVRSRLHHESMPRWLWRSTIIALTLGVAMVLTGIFI
ncbi:hypothetical protein ACFC0D_03455 [Streptomyces sp. NPDC056222]|uniref:hypothetical protein n=1 Tax=Streptomyces sp. NPDC056222 TaxID=3345749 RepID=UPI0035DA30EA